MGEIKAFPKKRGVLPGESLQKRCERLEGDKTYLLKQLLKWQEYARSLESKLMERRL